MHIYIYVYLERGRGGREGERHRPHAHTHIHHASTRRYASSNLGSPKVGSKLQDLPKVQLREDEVQCCGWGKMLNIGGF